MTPKPLTGMAFAEAETAAEAERLRRAAECHEAAAAGWRVHAEQECAEIDAEATAPLGGGK